MCSRVSLALQQVSEETLNNVLRICRDIAAPTRERVQRWPVVTAKLGQCRARGFIVTRASCDNAPVSSCECGTPVLDCTGNPFHAHRVVRTKPGRQDCPKSREPTFCPIYHKYAIKHSGPGWSYCTFAKCPKRHSAMALQRRGEQLQMFQKTLKADRRARLRHVFQRIWGRSDKYIQTQYCFNSRAWVDLHRSLRRTQTQGQSVRGLWRLVAIERKHERDAHGDGCNRAVR